MNLLQMSFVITWAKSFLTSEVVEAVRGQKIISWRTLWHFNSTFSSSLSASSAYQRFTKKSSVMTLSLHSASILRILELTSQGLIFSNLYNICFNKMCHRFFETDVRNLESTQSLSVCLVFFQSHLFLNQKKKKNICMGVFSSHFVPMINFKDSDFCKPFQINFFCLLLEFLLEKI